MRKSSYSSSGVLNWKLSIFHMTIVARADMKKLEPLTAVFYYLENNLSTDTVMFPFHNMIELLKLLTCKSDGITLLVIMLTHANFTQHC